MGVKHFVLVSIMVLSLVAMAQPVSTTASAVDDDWGDQCDGAPLITGDSDLREGSMTQSYDRQYANLQLQRGNYVTLEFTTPNEAQSPEVTISAEQDEEIGVRGIDNAGVEETGQYGMDTLIHPEPGETATVDIWAKQDESPFCIEVNDPDWETQYSFTMSIDRAYPDVTHYEVEQLEEEIADLREGNQESELAESLEEENEELESEIEELEDEIDGLEEELDGADEEIAALEEQIETLEERNENLQEEIEESDSPADELDVEVTPADGSASFEAGETATISVEGTLSESNTLFAGFPETRESVSFDETGTQELGLPDEPGTYDLALQSNSAEEVTTIEVESADVGGEGGEGDDVGGNGDDSISSDDGGEDDGSEEQEEGMPGFGAAVAVIALLTTFAVARLRGGKTE
ncbi:PGF-CTERM sorting domain-containing protein [Natronococcus roseus]|uniref:PGF-CTERM sorting domain-containing protein n=1 Tax=Natronococcus roseus TaxID=1052014 RepID=UPI00374CA8BF